MPSMTLSAVVYSPGTFNAENGGRIRFDWDTNIFCDPLPGTFTYTIKFRDSEGNYWQSGGNPVQISDTVTVLGQATHVGFWWTPPEMPCGCGVQPEWTVTSSCASLVEGNCTGLSGKTVYRAITGYAIGQQPLCIG